MQQRSIYKSIAAQLRLGVIVLLITCTVSEASDNSAFTEAESGQEIQQPSVDQQLAYNNSNSETVINRLLYMKTAFEEKSAEKMSDFFDFPTSNFMFIRRNDELAERLALNNNSISRRDFIELANIDTASFHPSLYQLLVLLDLDELRHSDVVERDVEIENDGCYYMYRLKIDESILIISYGSNSNMKYLDLVSGEECPEGSYFLYFDIGNDTLKFTGLEVAG
ncbi:hypothetical protein [Saccharospirillum mangrovi]|uniref:hypothetical protein n=1 Tax=Saccharospirillum mangrovi TaxID=2161747 RepID=UPI000D36EA55|nr:hypothetical protein [Saccharospirillum mangrovi]